MNIRQGYKDATLITPHASNLLPKSVDAFRATGAGNIGVLTQDGSEVILPILAGETITLKIKAVRSGTTTATGLVGYIV